MTCTPYYRQMHGIVVVKAKPTYTKSFFWTYRFFLNEQERREELTIIYIDKEEDKINLANNNLQKKTRIKKKLLQ